MSVLDRPTKGTRKALTLVAVLFVVAVLVGLGVWSTSGRTRAVTGSPAAAVESKCGLAGTPGQLNALPATWENIAGWYLPISETDGPGVRTLSGSWSCYARTQAGAVLAGWVIPMQVDGLAEDWQTVVREQTVPGPAQQVKLTSTRPTANGPVTLRGFSVASYSEDRATIAYYLHSENLEATCTADVAWLDGDWRLKLDDDGSTLTGCTSGVPPTFVPWGP